MNTFVLTIMNILISFCFFLIIYLISKTFLLKFFPPSLFSKYLSTTSKQSVPIPFFAFLLIILSLYVFLSQYYHISHIVKVLVLMISLYITIGTLPYSVKHKIVVAILYTCIVLFSDIITGFCIIYLKLQLSVFIVNLLMYFFALTIILGVFLLFLTITKKQSIVTVILLLINIFILMESTLWIQRQEVNKNVMFILLNIFALLLFNVIIILLIDYYNHAREKLKENQQILEIYIKTIEQINEHIEKFKHDLKNITMTISSSQLYNELKRVIEKFEEERIVIANIEKIPDPDMKLFFMNKVIEIFQKNIFLYFSIDNNIENPQIPKLDFIRLLGNLIDNAIENAVKSETRTIVLIWKKRSFIVQNSFSREYNIDLQQIYTKGYSTKKGSKGLGLSIVQDILNKYSQIFSLNTYIENDFFVQYLVWNIH